MLLDPVITTTSQNDSSGETQPPKATTDMLLDPLATTTSQNDGETQTGPLVTTTGAGSGKPTTSEAMTESSSDVNAIAGGIVCVVLVIVTLTVVTVVSIAAVAVGKKKRHSTFTTIPNQAYGINVTHTCAEVSAYDYPAVMDLDITIEVKQNEAYSANIVTTGNEAYATNIFTVGNEAYCAGIDIARK